LAKASSNFFYLYKTFPSFLMLVASSISTFFSSFFGGASFFWGISSVTISSSSGYLG
jgi:hypothetical protein